jgi:pyridoxamine 5'-phosphate oxidase family protein
VFTDVEYRFLTAHSEGRLSSIGPDNAPQVYPVSFVVDAVAGCIEIGGARLRDSPQYRNIRRDPRVTLVVYDESSPLMGTDPRYGRRIEIRGVAEASERSSPAMPGFGTDIIRIRPVRVQAWNLDGPGPQDRFVD